MKALAKLPPREVLLAQLLGLLQAPASQLAAHAATSRRARSRGSSTRSRKRAGAAAPSRDSRPDDERPEPEKEWHMQMEVTREQVKDFLKNMSLMDAATLVKELEDELGVSAAAPVAMAAAGAAGGRRGGGGGGRRRKTSRSS